MESEAQQESVGRGFLPTMVIVFFAITISNVILSLISLDVAKTFFPQSFAAGTTAAVHNAAVGRVISQVGAVNSAFEVIIAIAMTAVTNRVRYKPMLLSGVVLLVCSAIGCYLAEDFLTFQISFALEGAATVMVGVTGMSMIGDYLPQNKKARTIGYTIAIPALTTVIVSRLFATSITKIGGWQLNFLFIILPFAVLGLALSAIAVPMQPIKKSIKHAYKQVFTNKSAILCIIGIALLGAQVMGNFALPFYRQQLSLSLDDAATIQAVAAFMYFVAALVIGRLVIRTGAKLLAIICLAGNGVFTMIFFFMPSALIAVPLDMTHVWFNAAAVTAIAALVLDQVPQYRGTMMSMRSIVLNAGAALGSFVGGYLLIAFGTYEAVGIVIGIMSIAAAAVLLAVKDTSRG